MSIFMVLAMHVILRKVFPTTRLRNIHLHFLNVLQLYYMYVYMYIYFIYNILIHVGFIFVFCNFVCESLISHPSTFDKLCSGELCSERCNQCCEKWFLRSISDTVSQSEFKVYVNSKISLIKQLSKYLRVILLSM